MPSCVIEKILAKWVVGHLDSDTMEIAMIGSDTFRDRPQLRDYLPIPTSAPIIALDCGHFFQSASVGVRDVPSHGR